MKVKDGKDIMEMSIDELRRELIFVYAYSKRIKEMYDEVNNQLAILKGANNEIQR